MKLHDFNPGSSKPLLHLGHANGFPPATYLPMVEPLTRDYHLVSLLARPFWHNTPAEWLRDWSQLSEDLAEGLEHLGAKGIVGVGHSLGGVQTLMAAVNHPRLFSKIVLIDPTMLPPAYLWKVRLFKIFGKETRGSLVEGALRRRRHWESVETAFQSFKEKPLFRLWPEGTIRAYAESMTKDSPEGGVDLAYPPEWEAQIYRTIPTDVWGYAKRLSLPTLV